MENINGEQVAWFNRYMKYAITTKSCNICGTHISIWWIEHEPVLICSFCNFDIGEMLIPLGKIVDEVRNEK